MLHNVGKIGIPDRILRKPGKLSDDERQIVDLTPKIGIEIIKGFCGDPELLDIIRYRFRWFDSRGNCESGPDGYDLPLGSRMLAIAGAFDAMTTDTVYRAALSRETALGELFAGAGSQFDPELTHDFAKMLEDRPEILQHSVTQRWLQCLRTSSSEPVCNRDRNPAAQHAAATASGASAGESTRGNQSDIYLQHWLDNSRDGVLLLDGELNIVHFNNRLSLMTGIRPEAIIGQTWDQTLLGFKTDKRSRGMKTNKSTDLTEVLLSIRTGGGEQVAEMKLERPGQDSLPLEVHVTGVTGNGHSSNAGRGVMLVVRDLSEQTTLQEELTTLHKKSVTDPLTGVANRAHFDDSISGLCRLAERSKQTFSLIICDIDHFKKVNDVHGHQAGDEALVKFASLLQSHCRQGDLVSRYGGEEFVLLTPACDIGAATSRAEAIRASLEKTPLESIKNESVTASFGVTEFQSGDSPDTVVSRADRALLKAKDNGRNRVIQFGSGRQFETVVSGSERGSWRDWLPWSGPIDRDEFDIRTPVPADLAIEKLRGFIADHRGEIISVDENQVTISIKTFVPRSGRRRADQQVLVRAELTLSQKNGGGRRNSPLTNVHVLLQPVRNRDRRGHATRISFRKATDSLRSYLMGEVVR